MSFRDSVCHLLLLLLQLSCSILAACTQDDPVLVNVTQGTLLGRKQTSSATGQSFYSFQGIPYAQPPLMQLRFKAPQPPLPWSGVHDGKQEGNVCPQSDTFFSNGYTGDEDCLFLNVYTTQLPEVGECAHELTKAVMVYIHGGGFVVGSGNADFYGPEFIVAQDVVLVTINYRLGALGFSTTEDSEIPGNAGLKDQVAALKWVRQNIAHFGGDPDNVTIFGQSAGGASVHFLMLSPMAKGLFRRAISQSGCALNNWAYSTEGHSRTVRLAQALGCATNNSKDVLAFLRTIPAQQLVENVSLAISPEDMHRGYLPLPFVPTSEAGSRSGEEVFMSASPLDIIKSGNYNHVPYITGVTTCEGLFWVKDLMTNPAKMSVIDSDMQVLLPTDLYPYIDTNKSMEAARKMKHFYFGDQALTQDTLLQFAKLQSDVLFVYKVRESIVQQSQDPDPLYVYQFAFDGVLGMFKRVMGLGKLPGVCHADDLGYLFNVSLSAQQVQPDSAEAEVRAMMLHMWTNFAKTGDPSPATVTWQPVTPGKTNYLMIDRQPVMKTDLEKTNIQFWDELYQSASMEDSTLDNIK